MTITVDDRQVSLDSTNPSISVGISSPRAVVGVSVWCGNTETLTDWTYPNASEVATTLTAVTGSPFGNTEAEPLSTIHFGYLNGVSTGADNLVMTNSGGLFKATMGVTLNAAEDITVQDSDRIDLTLAAGDNTDHTQGLQLGGNSCWGVEAWRRQNGSLAFGAPLTGWTNRQSVDAGNNTGGIYDYDTIGSVDFNIGINLPATSPSQDIMVVGVAFTEQASGVTGTGAPAAQSASVAGTGERTVDGTGTPTAQAAQTAGAGVRGAVGSGTPGSQAAIVSASGVRSLSTSAALSAQASVVAGAGTVFSTVSIQLTAANSRELKDANGVLWSSLNGVIWEWYDTPGATTGNPVDSGTFNTSAAGEATFTVDNSSLANGEFGHLVLYHPTLPDVRASLRVPVVA